MKSVSPVRSCYIVGAKRTSIGMVGGLHRSRRIETLAEAAIRSLLDNLAMGANDIDSLFLGNQTAGDNPARLIAHASGLSDGCIATTIDQECASGLAAIVAGLRMIRLGEAESIIAGGAESFSTAPWRMARPRSSAQRPRVLETVLESSREPSGAQRHSGSEAIARRLGILREEQDAHVLSDAERERIARTQRRFIGEIVPLRSAPNEVRDEVAAELDAEELAASAPLLADVDGYPGSATRCNVVRPADGAAFVLIVSETMYRRLGKPPAFQVRGSVTTAASCNDMAMAPLMAVQKLIADDLAGDCSGVNRIELAELSSLQVLVMQRLLGLPKDRLNPDGGAVTRGFPGGAAGAVGVVRLFSEMIRAGRDGGTPDLGHPIGIAAAGTFDGAAVALSLERIA